MRASCVRWGRYSQGSVAFEQGHRTDGELTYAVQAQMLDVLREVSSRLAGLETWRRELRVVNNLQDTRAGLDELKQVKQNSAIRSKN